jgi:hypothetical protein
VFKTSFISGNAYGKFTPANNTKLEFELSEEKCEETAL